MSLVLEVDAVWKSYHEYPILKGCSFFLDRAGIYILKGPNGSGKSTLLRLCALLEEPDRGEITYYSETGVVRSDRTLRRRMTLVLPGGGIFNNSVVKNVAYGLKIRGVGRAEREVKVERALQRFGLGHKKNQNALTLSSGESRRLSLARAMVLDPEVLFLDEPMAYVDDESRTMIKETILAIREEGRRLVFIATHDVTRVESVAEKVLVIQEGKVVECPA
jgi:tungstate transport system ATP-binding protein